MQDNDTSAKRQALKGQWQTPPVVQQFSSTSAPCPPTADPLNIPIPASSNEYAKALQDAYRRGAQAASMSVQQSHSVANAGSMDLSTMKLGVPNPFKTMNCVNDNSNHDGAPATISIGRTDTLVNATPDVPLSNMNRIEQTRKVSINAQHRSISMPDMCKTEAVDEEEAKRLKRLARNRASARLRRLRKKNLVSNPFVPIEIIYVLIYVIFLIVST